MWANVAIWPRAAVGTLVATAVGQRRQEIELAVTRQTRVDRWPERDNRMDCLHRMVPDPIRYDAALHA